jgi:hypothetical protein
MDEGGLQGSSQRQKRGKNSFGGHIQYLSHPILVEPVAHFAAKFNLRSSYEGSVIRTFGAGGGAAFEVTHPVVQPHTLLELQTQPDACRQKRMRESRMLGSESVSRDPSLYQSSTRRLVDSLRDIGGQWFGGGGGGEKRWMQRLMDDGIDGLGFAVVVRRDIVILCARRKQNCGAKSHFGVATH